jgi:hypothetical protein
MGAPPPLQRCAPKRTWTGRHERSQEARNPMRRDERDTRACCEHVLAACAINHQGTSAALQTTNCATDHFVALCDATRRAQPLIGAVLEGPSRICKLEQAGPWISCVWRLHCMRVLMYHQKQRRCFKMTGRTKPVRVTQQSMGGCLRSDHSQSRPYLYSSHVQDSEIGMAWVGECSPGRNLYVSVPRLHHASTRSKSGRRQMVAARLLWSLFRGMVGRVVVHGHIAKMHPVRHQRYPESICSHAAPIRSLLTNGPLSGVCMTVSAPGVFPVPRID